MIRFHRRLNVCTPNAASDILASTFPAAKKKQVNNGPSSKPARRAGDPGDDS
jgi:hypothetical protein